MTTTAENVLVGQDGAVYRAPAGTPLPTSATDVLDGAFVELGFISESGVTEGQPQSTTNIKAWQGGSVVRVVRTEHAATFRFAFIETNEDTLAAYYGNYDAGTVEINAAQDDPAVWVIDVIDGDNLTRTVIPKGQVTERGDVTAATSDAIAYEVTLTAYEDPDYAGTASSPAKAYKHFATAGTSA